VSWVEAKRRLVAIEQLRAKRKKARLFIEEKREQRLLDELYVVQTRFSARSGYQE
jgi:flagellar biosynthesis chaperone FliJ